MMILVMLVCISERICQMISGWLCIFRSGLGQVLVSGCMCLLWLVVKIMVFMQGVLEGVVEFGCVFLFEFFDQVYQWCEGYVVVCGFEGVFYDQWDVFQVVIFVVVMLQVCEDVQYFQVVLQVYLFEVMVEGIDVGCDWQVGVVCFFLVVDGLVQYYFFILLDVGVVQQ